MECGRAFGYGNGYGLKSGELYCNACPDQSDCWTELLEQTKTDHPDFMRIYFNIYDSIKSQGAADPVKLTMIAYFKRYKTLPPHIMYMNANFRRGQRASAIT